jgi:hypothetical protein
VWGGLHAQRFFDAWFAAFGGIKNQLKLGREKSD